MTGYVLPLREELRVRDWERYCQVYCGLCRSLGRRCSRSARLLLSYDFTFLALLLGADGKPERRRCPAAPCRGRLGLAEDAALELAADECMILSWWKLRDQLRDEVGTKRLAAKAALGVCHPPYQDAAGRQCAFDALVRTQLRRLCALEAERCPSLDRPADAFARILTAAVPQTGERAHDRAMEQLLYHVGRWIYLTDAWDDAAEDLKSGNYNPILLRFGLSAPPDRHSEAGEQVERTLLHSVNLALSALRLLEEGPNTPILENILRWGLPSVHNAVLSGRWKDMKKPRVSRGV